MSLKKCDARGDFTLVLNHKFTWKEIGLTQKWQIAGLDNTVSSASLLGSDLSLHSHCVDQDCSCLFPVDLMETTLSQPNAWGFENAGMSENFFNELERAEGQQEQH